MLANISIDFNGTAKVFEYDYGLMPGNFYSLEICPFLGKKQLDSFELIFSNIQSGLIDWYEPEVNGSYNYLMGQLIVRGEFSQNIDSIELLAYLSNPEFRNQIEYKSTTVYIIADLDAEDEWDRTRSLILKENGGFQKITMEITI